MLIPVEGARAPMIQFISCLSRAPLIAEWTLLGAPVFKHIGSGDSGHSRWALADGGKEST